jgi:phosphoribosylamine--glycine ligase
METQVIESARAKNIPILSPDYNLGMLEASKLVGKDLLNKVGIPTPKFETVNREELTNRFKTIPRPFVLKYEDDRRVGLQTIVITDENYEEEYNAFMSAKQSGFMGRTYQDFLDQKFMIEEYLPGKAEYSWHALCNTTGWKFLGAARDYKKRYEGDKGHNTAGMGAYSPVYDLDDRVGEYCDKIVKHLIEQGTPYVGIIYLGIMTGPDGTPHILEINTRPGSPEGETILETVDNNL